MAVEKFDSKAVLSIKGVAVLLMVCNHIFIFSDLIYPDNMYLSLQVGTKSVAEYIGGFGKICVAIYAMLTGFAFYYSYQKQITIQEKYIAAGKKLKKFFLCYWSIMLLIYLPILWFMTDFTFDIKELILNLFGYKTTFCISAWYVRFYLELMLSFPFWNVIYTKLQTIDSKMGAVVLVLLSWIICVFSKNASFAFHGIISEYFYYLPMVILGYYLAENDIFSHFYNVTMKRGRLEVVGASIVCLCAVVLFRGVFKNMFGFNMDFLYAPIFVFCVWIVFTHSHSWIKTVFTILGKYSVELWFLHPVFLLQNFELQHIGYWPKLDILVLAWVVIVLMPVSFIVRTIVQKI